MVESDDRFDMGNMAEKGEEAPLKNFSPHGMGYPGETQEPRYRMTKNTVTKIVTLNPPDEIGHKYSLIWLHGLGDKGQGGYNQAIFFGDEVPTVPRSCKVILPTAPVKPVSVNNGMKMTSWYDVKTFNVEAGKGIVDMRRDKYNQADIRDSAAQIVALVQ